MSTQAARAAARSRVAADVGGTFTDVVTFDEISGASFYGKTLTTPEHLVEGIINGVHKACQGRPVTEDALAQLGQRVEEAVRATGSAELTTHDVGLAILGPLQELDLVAYLRFASVYRAFDSLEDFEAAIAELREGMRRAAADEDDREDDVGAVTGGQEDHRGSGGTAQVPVPANAAD